MNKATPTVRVIAWYRPFAGGLVSFSEAAEITRTAEGYLVEFGTMGLKNSGDTERIFIAENNEPSSVFATEDEALAFVSARRFSAR